MRVLVVGLGQIAQRHIRNLKVIEPDCEIAVWRQRSDLQGWQPPTGLLVDRWLYRQREAEDWEPEAVIVANPATEHVPVAYLFLTNGAHVFIEKPLSDTLREHSYPSVANLLQEAVRLNRVCYIGYDLRHYRPLQLVKEAISEGRIGRPLSIRCEVGQYLPDWRPGRDYRQSVSARSELGGGVILELSHEIDYARWLMGEVAAVTAQTGKVSDLEIDVEDTADILLRFESGALGNIHMDMTDRAPMRRCRVVGTEGTIECDLSGEKWGQAWLYRPGRPMELLVDWDIETEDPLLEEMRHFLACCRGESVPPVDGAEGRRVLEICLAAKRSAAEGRMVTVGHSESSGS